MLRKRRLRRRHLSVVFLPLINQGSRRKINREIRRERAKTNREIRRERAKTLSVYGYYPNMESRQRPFLLLW